MDIKSNVWIIKFYCSQNILAIIIRFYNKFISNKVIHVNARIARNEFLEFKFKSE